jgi:hypothetical protein
MNLELKERIGKLENQFETLRDAVAKRVKHCLAAPTGVDSLFVYPCLLF